MTIHSVLLAKRLLGMSLILLLLAGCASLRGKPSGDRRDDAYARADLDELLGFGAELAGKTGTARAETCRSLLNRQKEEPGTGVQLHLLAGRLLSDACGDIPKILAGVDAIPAKDLSDKQVGQWVAAQTEALKRLHHASKRLAALERKQKTVQSVLESKEPKAPAKGPKPAKDGEARLLRDKLEAIRAMEKKLDESGDGN